MVSSVVALKGCLHWPYTINTLGEKKETWGEEFASLLAYSPEGRQWNVEIQSWIENEETLKRFQEIGRCTVCAINTQLFVWIIYKFTKCDYFWCLKRLDLKKWGEGKNRSPILLHIWNHEELQETIVWLNYTPPNCRLFHPCFPPPIFSRLAHWFTDLGAHIFLKYNTQNSWLLAVLCSGF